MMSGCSIQPSSLYNVYKDFLILIEGTSCCVASPESARSWPPDRPHSKLVGSLVQETSPISTPDRLYIVPRRINLGLVKTPQSQKEIKPGLQKTINSFIQLPSRELTYPPDKAYLKMIFLFPRWDMLIPWRVCHLGFLDDALERHSALKPFIPTILRWSCLPSLEWSGTNIQDPLNTHKKYITHNEWATGLGPILTHGLV